MLELIRGNGGRFESFMEIGILVYPVCTCAFFAKGSGHPVSSMASSPLLGELTRFLAEPDP